MPSFHKLSLVTYTTLITDPQRQSVDTCTFLCQGQVGPSSARVLHGRLEAREQAVCIVRISTAWRRLCLRKGCACAAGITGGNTGHIPLHCIQAPGALGAYQHKGDPCCYLMKAEVPFSVSPSQLFVWSSLKRLDTSKADSNVSACRKDLVQPIRRLPSTTSSCLLWSRTICHTW